MNQFANKRVLIKPIPAVNTAEILKMQAKINTWMTTGLLIKYEIHTAGNVVIFNICLKKDAS